MSDSGRIARTGSVQVVMSRNAPSSLVRGKLSTNGFKSGRPHQARARRARVALIGDENTTRFLIETILLPSGEFACAGQYAIFKAALMDLPEVRPDLILIDAGLRALPDIDGVRKLQALKPRPVIVWVGDPIRLRRLKDSFKSDACVFLMKPIPKEACLASLRQLLLKHSFRQSRADSTPALNGNGTSHKATGLLSPREEQVMTGLTEGLTYKEIAKRLQMTDRMVHKYQHRGFVKLGASNRTEAGILLMNLLRSAEPDRRTAARSWVPFGTLARISDKA
jgi:DNA-binding NarL/FixJ family response regulator